MNFFPSFRFRQRQPGDTKGMSRAIVQVITASMICIFVIEQVAAQQDADGADAINNANATAAESNASSVPDDVDISTGIVPTCANYDPANAILFPWFVQLLGCVTLFVLTRFNLPIPYAAVMFIEGAIMGGIVVQDVCNENRLHDSVRQWINIDSGVLLLIFLPGLIFKDAVEIPINLFQVAIGKLTRAVSPLSCRMPRCVARRPASSKCKYCIRY